MIRFGLLLVLAGSPGLVAVTKAASGGGPKRADDAFVLALQRGGGFVNPDKEPLAHYRFTVARDGSWEFRPLKGEARKGKLRADDLNKWLKEIKAGGLDKLKSNPSLGAADEPFLDITIRTRDSKEQKRIPLQEKVAQAIDRKVLGLAKAGK
jgi:hypothetical protein